MRAIILALAALPLATVSAQSITLNQISTTFNRPIGIDHHEPTNTVVFSVNYSSGQPLNFERILPDGTHVPFSNVSGLTDEVKIATIRSGAGGGFNTGDLFVGNGVDGEIARVSADGMTVDNPWISLGSGNGLMRGGLYHDRTGVFGNDLIAVTTVGKVWRISSGKVATELAAVGTHLEGVITVPDNATKYGPLAGKIICGAENQGLLYSIDTAGTVASYAIGVNIEDIDLIPADENFFGVNFGSNRILAAPAAEFSGLEGDILLTQEFHSMTGLYVLTWDGTNLTAPELGLTASSQRPSQWEHVTFSPAGIAPFPGFVPPSPCGQTVVGQVGSLVTFTVQASDPVLTEVVTLTATGVPAGATFSPTLPANGNPVSSTFQWTPTPGQEGSYQIVATATDAGGLSSFCVIDLQIDCTGSIAHYGAGHPGAGGVIPTIDSDCPVIGFTTTVRTAGAQPNRIGCLLLGDQKISAPSFGGTLLVQPLSGISVMSDGSGAHAEPVFVPLDLNLVGAQYYWQAGFVDPGAFGRVSFTDGLEATIGG